jgi:peptide-methionine (S)-S-oxide reductase
MKNTKNLLGFVIAIFMFGIYACAQTQPSKNKIIENNMDTTLKEGQASATFGAGCFWCVEAVFQQLEGVDTVISGYSGGHVPNPSYREVTYGKTGHAEVCRIVYDPQKVSYRDLLQALFISHDPTTLNRQGNDAGTQYRSVIFYHNDNQKVEAEKVIKELTEARTFEAPIVTAVEPLSSFYVAEDYHQNYYNLNGNEGYCQYVIRPKVEKFQKVFKHNLKNKSTY